jgi:hypothetical protein
MSHVFSVRVMNCCLFVRVNFSFILFFVQGHFMFCMSYCPIVLLRMMRRFPWSTHILRAKPIAWSASIDESLFLILTVAVVALVCNDK